MASPSPKCHKTAFHPTLPTPPSHACRHHAMPCFLFGEFSCRCPLSLPKMSSPASPCHGMEASLQAVQYGGQGQRRLRPSQMLGGYTHIQIQWKPLPSSPAFKPIMCKKRRERRCARAGTACLPMSCLISLSAREKEGFSLEGQYTCTAHNVFHTLNQPMALSSIPCQK